MLKRKLQDIVLELQNQNAEPLKLVIAIGTKKKKQDHSKINYHIKGKLYAWIIRHPQVLQSPISNDCLKGFFDDKTEPHVVPKLVIQVSVRELHNRLVSDPNDGGIKDSRDEENNIIISDSTLCSLLTQNFKQMSSR